MDYNIKIINLVSYIVRISHSKRYSEYLEYSNWTSYDKSVLWLMTIKSLII